MAGRPWTETETACVRELAAQGLSDARIADALPGRTRSGVSQLRERLGIAAGLSRPFATLTRVVSETPETRVLAPTETAERDAAEVWDAAEKRTATDVRRAEVENVAVLQIMTDKPVAISISSDWHLRTKGANWLKELREYAEAVRDTPGAYAVAVGDLLDNPIKYERAVEEVPDDLQLLAHLFGTFGYKLLGTTDGNHDAWSRAFAGIDALKWLADRHRIHYAPDELTYIVELIDPKSQERTARYTIATRHKYYRHSNLNPSHACFRWLEDRVGQWPQMEDGSELIPDILAIGHNHVAVCDERTFKNKGIWGARMGAWQLTTSFGRAGGWRQSPPTAPTFILYPHRSRPIKGDSLYGRAFEVLAHERASWKA